MPSALKTVTVMCGVLALALLVSRSPVCAAETYEYDPAGRLLGVTYADGSSLAYTYDDNGNVLAITSSGALLIVTIDIKPGSFPNSINLGSNGNVPVAVLSTATFDARTVDPTTVTLAGAGVALKGKGRPQAAVEDVNGDGRPDLVVHVDTSALQLSGTDTEAVLNGKTFGGQAIQGRDFVRIVPP
ncbi:MAG: hypothetical protein ACREMB_22840 [Candidatus Rokuibacteriota bacterium]